MRGDSSGKVTKPATVDTGATLQVRALPLTAPALCWACSARVPVTRGHDTMHVCSRFLVLHRLELTAPSPQLRGCLLSPALSNGPGRTGVGDCSLRHPFSLSPPTFRTLAAQLRLLHTLQPNTRCYRRPVARDGQALTCSAAKSQSTS